MEEKIRHLGSRRSSIPKRGRTSSAAVYRAYRLGGRKNHRRTPLRQGARPVRSENQKPGRGTAQTRIPRSNGTGSHQGGRRRPAPRTQAEDDHGRHRQGHCRRIGKGRGRQIDRHGQPRGRPAEHGIPRRHPRRRHIRAFAAQDVRSGRATCPTPCRKRAQTTSSLRSRWTSG